MQTANIPLGAGLTEQQARDIDAGGEVAIVFAMLALAKMLADQRAAVAARQAGSAEARQEKAGAQGGTSRQQAAAPPSARRIGPSPVPTAAAG